MRAVPPSDVLKPPMGPAEELSRPGVQRVVTESIRESLRTSIGLVGSSNNDPHAERGSFVEPLNPTVGQCAHSRDSAMEPSRLFVAVGGL